MENDKNGVQSDLINQINQYTNVENLKNDKEVLEKLNLLPQNIIESHLKTQDKSDLLKNLFTAVTRLLESYQKACLNMASTTIDVYHS